MDIGPDQAEIKHTIKHLSSVNKQTYKHTTPEQSPTLFLWYVVVTLCCIWWDGKTAVIKMIRLIDDFAIIFFGKNIARKAMLQY